MVARTLIVPPSGRVGPVSPQERQQILSASPMRGKYDRTIDRESAYEILSQRRSNAAQGSVPPMPRQGGTTPDARRGMSQTERVVSNMASSAARSIGTQIGRAIFRSILGNLSRR